MKELKKLPQDVIDKIAAGEVVSRVSFAIKELVENSIDAGANQITVLVKDGGLTFVSVKDNGKGICMEDLNVICERFTTSKLTKAEDLLTIGTFGFRGEALASLTYVAKVTITSKPMNQEMGFRGKYVDGKLVDELMPCAAVDGTTILVEDFFYNIPTRRSALQRHSTEYAQIVEIVKKYAVHFSGTRFISFICKLIGKSIPDVSTSGNLSKYDAIGVIHGSEIKNELLQISASKSFNFDKVLHQIVENDNAQPSDVIIKLKWVVEGFITNSNYSRKNPEFILFINDRLVNCRRLSKMLDVVYSDLVRKGQFPFVYLSLNIPSQHVDVNVHPNKSEVFFLFEAELLDFIGNIVNSTLKSATQSRVFKAPVIQPLVGAQLSNRLISATDEAQLKGTGLPENSQSPAKRIGDTPTNIKPSKMVRTDPKDASIDHLFRQMSSNKIESNFEGGSFEVDIIKYATHQFINEINDLQKEIEGRASQSFKVLLSEMVYVGIVDNNYCLSQYKSELFIMDYLELSKEMFYQKIIKSLGYLGTIRLSSPLFVADLIKLFLSSELGATEAGINTHNIEETQSIVQNFCILLSKKINLLQQYFGIILELSDETRPESLALLGLPDVLESYVPILSALPVFLYRICSHVSWLKEKDFFRSFAFEVAEFYSIFPRLSQNYNHVNPTDFPMSLEETEDSKNLVQLLQHILVPAIRKYLSPPKEFQELTTGVIRSLTSMENLYKVFERC